MPFELVEFAETPRRFHQRSLPEAPTPQVWLNTILDPALVLGSTQRDESIVDRDACVAAGVDVVRRRSGGGAVLLVPGAVTWFDVIVPAGGPGWSDDVHRPMVWLGHHLAASLHVALGSGADIAVHDGPMQRTEFSSLICFDGFGPGEVLLDGRKLVGISQRRTREVARLQCCLYHRDVTGDLLDLLAPHVRPDASLLLPVATISAEVSSRLVAGLPNRLA